MSWNYLFPINGGVKVLKLAIKESTEFVQLAWVECAKKKGQNKKINDLTG
jgi:hypothetical protein